MGRWSRPDSRGLGAVGPLSQPALARHHDRLGAALDPDLVEDAGDVVAYRLLGELEARRDLRVVQALRDLLQDLRLARGESAEAGRAAEKPAQLLEQAGKRRLVLDQDVVVGVERHEARA